MAQVAENAKELREQQVKEFQAKADETNKARTGKGTRVQVGSTRGKNTQVITFEAFDESQPDSLPKTIAEFVEITKAKDEDALVAYLIEGFNADSYRTASDPIAEYVEPTWDEDATKAFRLVVRNYSNNAGVSIEDAVTLIKPGFAAAQAKKLQK